MVFVLKSCKHLCFVQGIDVCCLIDEDIVNVDLLFRDDKEFKVSNVCFGYEKWFALC